MSFISNKCRFRTLSVDTFFQRTAILYLPQVRTRCDCRLKLFAMKKLLRLLAVAFIVVSCGNDEEGFAYEEVDVPGIQMSRFSLCLLNQ